MSTGLCATCGDPVVIAANGRVLTRCKPSNSGRSTPPTANPSPGGRWSTSGDTGLAGHAPHAATWACVSKRLRAWEDRDNKRNAPGILADPEDAADHLIGGGW